MDLLIVAAVFATVVAIIVVPITKSVVAFAGLLAVAIVSPSFTLIQLAYSVDWNVLAVLLGTWIIIDYMIGSNLPKYIAYKISMKVGNAVLTVLLISVVAGLVSTFLANVQVVLLFAPVAMIIGKSVGLDPLVVSMVVAIASNYMGTALMLGDLPPLLLHSIAGAEFFDFLFFRGKPSSFFLLLASFILSLLVFYRIWFRPTSRDSGSTAWIYEKPDVAKIPALLSVAALAALMFLAAIRSLLALPLGVLAMGVALLTATLLEVLRFFDKRIPRFDEVLKDVEWEALAFYVALFGLTSALEVSGFFEEISQQLAQALSSSTFLAYGSIYWITALLSMFVEHDALLLMLLHMVKDIAKTVPLDPWPYYWGIVWASTLGSNATIAAAPTLYLALILAEKESNAKRSWKSWIKITLPFSLVSSAIHFAISIPFVFF